MRRCRVGSRPSRVVVARRRRASSSRVLVPPDPPVRPVRDASPTRRTLGSFTSRLETARRAPLLPRRTQSRPASSRHQQTVDVVHVHRSPVATHERRVLADSRRADERRRRGSIEIRLRLARRGPRRNRRTTRRAECRTPKGRTPRRGGRKKSSETSPMRPRGGRGRTRRRDGGVVRFRVGVGFRDAFEIERDFSNGAAAAAAAAATSATFASEERPRPCSADTRDVETRRGVAQTPATKRRAAARRVDARRDRGEIARERKSSSSSPPARRVQTDRTRLGIVRGRGGRAASSAAARDSAARDSLSSDASSPPARG